MRVTLEIVEGPELGRTVRLAPRELRQFGRTDWADVAFANDESMSAVHFSLESDGQVVVLRDLESSNGTLVNGEKATEQVLADGDTIKAGDTTLLVRIEGGGDPEAVAVVAAAVAASALSRPKSVDKKVDFTVEPCMSGLTLYRGSVEQISAAHLADTLARKTPLYLLVDFNKLGEPAPEDLADPQHLFDWLPSEAAAAVSPLIVAAAEYKAWFDLVEKGWGGEGIVCVFSSQDPSDVRSHLRAEARTRDDSVVGYCWPAVLGPMLMYSRNEDVEKLLKGIDAVLVEFPDLPETWQIFAHEDFGETLQSLGFRRQESQPIDSAVESKL